MEKAAEAGGEASSGMGMGLGAGFGMMMPGMINKSMSQAGQNSGQGVQAGGQQSVPMVECTKCKTSIPVGSKFCSECGNKVEKGKFCSKCGVPLSADAKFCSGCGEKVQKK